MIKETLKDVNKVAISKINCETKENVFIVDIAGEYYLTFEKLNRFSIEGWHIIIVLLFLASIVCIYIIVKRRYFFW